jgi:hypothetical protein
MGGIHRCLEVNTLVRLNRQRLELRLSPPSAPEPISEEGIWDLIKNDKLGIYCPRGSRGESTASSYHSSGAPLRVKNARRLSKLEWEAGQERIEATG